MSTAKVGVHLVAELCRKNDIRHLVFSPGSRSAPLVIALSSLADVRCFVIPDERSAGYFALGMAQQLRQTVAVVCTSGTAVLNLLPACCEAYYQEIPLLLLTADRPVGAAQYGANQAIDQEELFGRFAQDYSIDADHDDPQKITTVVAEAIRHTQTRMRPARLNIHLQEPLYETTDKPLSLLVPAQPTSSGGEACSTAEVPQADALAASARKLVLVGLHDYNEKFRGQIEHLARRQDTVVLVEAPSNCTVAMALHDFDSCLTALPAVSVSSFAPEMVITFGRQFVSKKIREFLQTHPPRFHWHVSERGASESKNFFHLPEERVFALAEHTAFRRFNEWAESASSDFNSRWQSLAQQVEKLKYSYLTKAPFSDFKAMQKIIAHLPEGSQVQYGNSTPVRYANFFRHHASLSVYANRGTSGIDGCLSTAVGAACVHKGLTICIIGDVSFLYDSNALWNRHLPPNFRIIVINNSGGNIFRLIDGPTRVPGFETFFETQHRFRMEPLAKMYGLDYYFCDCSKALDEALSSFYQPTEGHPAILEIKTDNECSAAVFKDYFKTLNPNYDGKKVD